jgi:hypothetical protein
MIVATTINLDKLTRNENLFEKSREIKLQNPPMEELN